MFFCICSFFSSIKKITFFLGEVFGESSWKEGGLMEIQVVLHE